jgi:hypothetical protein
LSGYVVSDGGRRDRVKAQAVGGDDAIVEDVVYVGLGGEAAQGGGVVFVEGGLDGGDAEVLVAPGKMRAGGGDAGFGVTGDGGVAVEDEVAMRSDAAGVDLGSDLGSDLGAGEAGEKERQDEGSPEDAMADCTCKGDAASGRRKHWVGGDGHGDTSL